MKKLGRFFRNIKFDFLYSKQSRPLW